MVQRARSDAIFASPMLLIAAIIIAAAVFVLDTITNLEIAVAVLYVAVVLIAFRILPLRGVMLVSVGCIILTLLSALLSFGYPPHPAGLMNCFISIVAIVVTTYLGWKNQAAEIALQNARSELARVNRVVTIGELTAAIAHEVNQPIGGAVTNAEAALRFLDLQPPDLEEVRHALDDVVTDGRRASEIVMRIRALIRKTPSDRGRLNVNDTITEVLGLMRSEIQRNRVALQTQLAADLPAVLADRVQLEQVVLNLTLNAIEAMAAKADNAREMLISSYRQDANNILVTVRDSGTGLQPDHAAHIFEAFQTTKIGGMGMGLSICRSIVEAHGGRIWCSPAPQGGAIFYFTLPVALG